MRAAPEPFERRQRGPEPHDQIACSCQFALVQIGARIGPVQIGAFPALELAELRP